MLAFAVTGGNMFQAWNVADTTQAYFGVPPWASGLTLAVLCLFIARKQNFPKGRVIPLREALALGAVEAKQTVTLIAEPGARLHLYGKGEPRPGRKMGHVTRLGS